MSLELRPETERRLRQEAARRGQDVNTLADTLVAAGLKSIASPFDSVAAAPEDQFSPEAMAASVESVRRAFADLDAGRTASAEEVFATAYAQRDIRKCRMTSRDE